MVLALTSQWRRLAIASASLLVLGACETIPTPGAPEQPAADAVDRSPRVESEIVRGRQALAAGDLSSAQSAFTAALRGSPNDPEPAIGLAETYLAMGDVETAGRVFDIVAGSKGGEGDARLLQGRGLVALGQGQTDQAIGFLEESVERDSTLWRAWAGLGRAYGRKGNMRQARSAFSRAEENAPSPAVVMNDMGMLHLEKDDPGAALEAFQRALAVDPGNAIASANARIARAMLGEYDAAIAGARPDELPHVLNNVGYIAVVNGDFEVADRLLRRAIEISPVYHEAASANLDLLAQAMNGEPVGMGGGPGAGGLQVSTGIDSALLAAASETAPTAPSAVADEPSRGAIAAEATNPAGSEEIARSAAAQPPTAVAPSSGESATAAAPVAATGAADAVMAHGFRWDAKPQSAASPKKRKRKAARPAAQPEETDPREAGWPSISVPAGDAAAEAGAGATQAGEAPAESPQQQPADDRAEPETVASDPADEAEVAVSPRSEDRTAATPE